MHSINIFKNKNKKILYYFLIVYIIKNQIKILLFFLLSYIFICLLIVNKNPFIFFNIIKYLNNFLYQYIIMHKEIKLKLYLVYVFI